MGEVIVITSGKGGVGKTTTVANIGTGLAMMGKKQWLWTRISVFETLTLCWDLRTGSFTTWWMWFMEAVG